jgi:MarR family transcriptional regulator, lower aerobic nicotinate degradation pathway regulator
MDVTTRARTTSHNRRQREDALVDALAQLTFAVHAVLSEVGAEYDLSVTQLRLLGILRDRTSPMAEVARYLGLDKSSVTGLVSRAEARDLLQRRPSPDDRRGVLVGMTANGRALARRVERDVRHRLLSLTETLTPADQTQLVALVERVARREP